jgi:acylphosphatase
MANNQSEIIAKHIIFTGHVQGVGFRFTAYRIANRHQLSGFVRNLPDGGVEMLAQGRTEDVDSCVEDIKADFADYIRQTIIEDVPLNPAYKNFRIAF